MSAVMTGRRGWFTSGLILTVVLSACSKDEPFGPLPVGEAQVGVTAYFDLDGAPGFGGADQPAPGLRFEVVLPGSGTAVASGAADAMGQIALTEIPVGTYDFRVDPAYLGDSLFVSQIDTTRLTLVPGDVVSLQVGVTAPTLSMSEARSAPEGRRVWVRGLALNSRFSSIDGALHVRESTGEAMRVVFPSAVVGSPGDSVRVLGVTTGTGSRRFLTGGFVSVVANDVRPIVPLDVSLADANTAGGGALDARLVVVRTGTVTDAVTMPFVGQRVTVSDGTTDLTVMLLSQNGFDTPPQIGAPVQSLAGVLVPVAGSSVWQLVPRGFGDARFDPVPPVPAGAR